MSKKPSGQAAPGKIAKTHERPNPSGKRDAPDMTLNKKPLRPY